MRRQVKESKCFTRERKIAEKKYVSEGGKRGEKAKRRRKKKRKLEYKEKGKIRKY